MRISSVLAIVLPWIALPAAAQTWDQGDPIAHWRSSLSTAAAAVLARRQAPSGGVAGEFDSYVFTLQWSPAMCETRPGLPECAGGSGRFSSGNLTLHGLWPDKDGDTTNSYGHCGVDDATRALDRASTWCRLPALGLTSGTASRLSEVMPSVASCLEKHEWIKHGTCTGLTPEDYFGRAAALVVHVAGTNFGRYLSSNTGRTVAGDALLAAFERDFGAGTGSMVKLTCAKVHGAQLLIDVRLKLAKSLRPAAELGRMLLPGGGKGNCPASFGIDAF